MPNNLPALGHYFLVRTIVGNRLSVCRLQQPLTPIFGAMDNLSGYGSLYWKVDKLVDDNTELASFSIRANRKEVVVAYPHQSGPRTYCGAAFVIRSLTDQPPFFNTILPVPGEVHQYRTYCCCFCGKGYYGIEGTTKHKCAD